MGGSAFSWLLNADKAKDGRVTERFAVACASGLAQSPRPEGGKVGECEEEMQSRSMLRKMCMRGREKAGMPAGSKHAAVNRACVRQKGRGRAGEGPASGKCEDEHPVVTMMFWPINDA